MANSSLTKVAAMVVGGMFLIVGGDIAGTALTREGVAPVYVAWTRFAVAAVLLAPFCGLVRSDFRMDWRLVLRALLIVLGIVCILTALRTEQVANVFGAFFVSPIFAFILSVLLLREKATLVRAALLLISFGGVLLVVKPGADMSVGMLFALAAGLFHGAYLVVTRWLAGEFRPRFLLFTQLAIGAVVLAPFGVVEAVAVDTRGTLLLLISALGSAVGNLLLVLANRIASANVIAPLIYSQLIHAAVLGWLVFGTWPDAHSFIGLAIIISAGLASLLVAGRGR